jgi:hypothetical protein
MEKMMPLPINVKLIICRLPQDIVNHIIPYTYTLQSTEITKDIHSYYESKNIIKKIFHDRYQHLFLYEKDADLNWLVSDILCFMNRHRACYYNYVDQLYSIFRRVYMLKDMENSTLKKIVNKSQKKNVHYQFHIYWGMLTPDERYRFIEIQKKIRF